MTIPLFVAAASCSGAESTVGDGGSEATQDVMSSADSPSPGDEFQGFDVSSDTTADTRTDSTSDVTPSESGGEASADGPLDSGFEGGSVDASDGGGSDAVLLDAPFEVGPDTSAACPAMQPTSGMVCFDLGISCKYGATPMSGAICICQTTTHKWHCLFL